MKLMPLTKNQLIQLRDRGYTYADVGNRMIKKITYNDIFVNEDDVEEIMRKYPPDKNIE